MDMGANAHHIQRDSGANVQAVWASRGHDRAVEA